MTRFVTLLLLCLIGFSPVASANDGLRIGVVDVDKVLSGSTAAQALQTQLQSRKDAFQKEFSGKEKTLKTTEDSLLQEKDKLSPEEFAKKRQAYEISIMETRKLFQKSRASLDRGVAEAMQELRRHIAEAAADVADEKGFSIVLTRDNVLIADKTLDITDAVLTRLNTKVTNIPLKVE